MNDFRVHKPQTAPEKSRPILENVQKAFGSIPNLMGTFAESPLRWKAMRPCRGFSTRAV